MSNIANSDMCTLSLAAQSGLTVPTQIFFWRYLHYVIYLRGKFQVQWMYFAWDMRLSKFPRKMQILLIGLSPKLQYLRQSTIFFQTACADLHQTLASTRSKVNEQNRKTSIEQPLRGSVVAYVEWLVSSFWRAAVLRRDASWPRENDHIGEAIYKIRVCSPCACNPSSHHWTVK